VTQATTLRALLAKEGCLTLPGVFDGISARVAASLGFDALYMTGYGVVASALGVADAGTATFTEMLDRVRVIAAAGNKPFIADGDTGYGGLLNVDRTVRGYASAGASGIQLEDQEFPKKCGHTEFRRVIPLEDAVAKIRVAVDARPDRDFLIVARTDARYSEGMDAALRRGERFLRAGADVLFVESPESLEELRRVAETFKGAVLLANMVEGGRTPYLSAGELASMGFKIGLYPASGFLTAAGSLQLVYRQLKAAGTATGIATVNFDIAGLGRTLGTAEVLTSPTAATTSAVLTAVQGKAIVGGSVTSITGAQLTINGNIQPGEAEVGANTISDHQRGRVAVNGSFTAKFSSTTLQALFDAQTPTSLILVVADSASPTADFITFVMTNVKLFSDTSNSNDLGLVGAGEKSGVFWAFRAKDGAKVWSTQVSPGGVTGGMQWGSATDGNTLYVSASNAGPSLNGGGGAPGPWKLANGQTVYSGGWAAVDAATGKIKWTTPDPYGSRAEGAVTLANGVVFGCNMQGTMFALNAKSGAQLWQYQLGTPNACTAGGDRDSLRTRCTGRGRRGRD